MIRDSFKYVVYFAILIVLQIFVFNNVQFSNYINPMIYVLFILILPFEIRGWILLLTAFATGLSVDLFMNTPGMHASASVAMAFARPYIISLLSQRSDVEFKGAVFMSITGIQWFAKYTFILVFIHHLILFYIEIFSFNHFFLTMLRVLLSSVITSIVIIIAQYFTFQNK